MKFWRPVVRGRGGRKHGTCILENMGSGYFVGQREEKCQKEEQCVQNYLSKTKICFRGDSTAGMTKPQSAGHLWPLGPIWVALEIQWKNAFLKKRKKNPDMPRFAQFACHLIFFRWKTPTPFLNQGASHSQARLAMLGFFLLTTWPTFKEKSNIGSLYCVLYLT